ncbi:MAG: NPCBM/NEW2 domain-containing protein, partial [Proteobacteria bacterium]|nr:NPCBM/NEW2 domain-containing protein [Pseudomonadota bacterium]
NIKRSDNVYVQGEVRYFGAPLEGFSNTLNTVSGSQGKVKLAIGWTQKEDDGWDTAKTEVESDQIRLFLVRQSNPDRPFGEIIYDISKIWTHSDEPDDEAMVADNDSIELEDGQTNSGSKPLPRVFVKPGTILKPYTPGAITQTAPPAAAQTTVPQATVQTSPPATVQAAPKVTAPVGVTSIKQRPKGVQNYDFYTSARSAKWMSSAGPLSFPGSGNDKKGFVRTLSKGYLNSGNAAVDLLETHPQWKSGGWIDGQYPLMILGDNLHFKSVVGFLKGANLTDGVTFQVYVKENNQYHRIASNRVSAKKYVSIDADLSRWAGKKVQLVLRVRAGNTSDHDWAVWVKPRLTK